MSWKTKKLGEVIEVLSGYAFDSKLFSTETGIPLIRIRDVVRGYSKTYYTGKFSEVFLVNQGDILIGMDGEFNIARWQGEPALLNQRVCKISTSCSKTLHSRYLSYALPKKLKEIEDRTPFVTVKHLSVKDIKNIDIPLPPLHIQQQIADTLDKADALRQKDQQLLQKYDELAQSIFYEMFGDPVENKFGFPVAQLSRLLSTEKAGTKCGPFGSALKRDEYVQHGVTVWVMDNIQVDEFNPIGCLYITEEKYEELSSYNVEAGDIIISRAGTVGKMCVVTSNRGKSIISSNLIRLSLNKDKINPYWFVKLMSYFTSKVGRLKTGADGTFTHMNTGVLKELSFPLPPVQLQNKYVDSLINIRKQKRILQMKNSDFLFNNLSQLSFS